VLYEKPVGVLPEALVQHIEIAGTFRAHRVGAQLETAGFGRDVLHASEAGSARRGRSGGPPGGLSCRHRGTLLGGGSLGESYGRDTENGGAEYQIYTSSLRTVAHCALL
jgi:hypothetical protein